MPSYFQNHLTIFHFSRSTLTVYWVMMRYIKIHLTYLLTYSTSNRYISTTHSVNDSRRVNVLKRQTSTRKYNSI